VILKQGLRALVIYFRLLAVYFAGTASRERMSSVARL
jgi:hypothetical protein